MKCIPCERAFRPIHTERKRKRRRSDEFIKNAIEFYIRERQRSKKKIFRFRFRSNTKESLGSADVGVVFPLKVHSHPVKANAKAVKFPS